MKKNSIFNLQKRKLFKEYISRKQYILIEYDYFLLKILSKSRIISKQTRALSIFYLSFLCNSGPVTKQKNVCLRSGYKRSAINYFGLNRCFARETIGLGFFPGYSPAKR